AEDRARAGERWGRGGVKPLRVPVSIGSRLLHRPHPAHRAGPAALLPELIRELDEEPVVLTLQASEREGVVGAERRAVAEEGDGPGRRRVGREEIDAEAVGLALPDRLAADEDGRA